MGRVRENNRMDEKLKILCAVGARPNFPKVARLSPYLKDTDFRILHMEQHTSDEMSGIILKQLEITPEYFGKAEEVMKEFKPHILIVVGDVNSAKEACLIGKKLGIKIAHIESGLRSFDLTMPEEINRIVIDLMADIHFVTEQSGMDNLEKEDIKGILVGNTMFDTARYYQKQIDAQPLPYKDYILFTAHRPSNVDGDSIIQIEELLQKLSEKYTVVFPIHPRTKVKNVGKTILLPPQSYFAFHKLLKNAKWVLTDSGGVQEEAWFYHVPCLTLRENTERPSTLEWNKLVGMDTKRILSLLETPNASQRIAQCLKSLF